MLNMELNPISKTEAARYMGVKGAPDDSVSALLDEAERTIRSRITPKYVYRETPLCFENSGVRLECMNVPLGGADIRKHLEGCTKAIILAATLTTEADKLIRQAEVRGMAEALALDCLCSAAIEQVCDCAEKEIFSRNSYSYRTWRFSPGYGDFPIEHQKDFLASLNTQRRIGLTVTDSCLLIPTKSVTAIIGISENPINVKEKGCEICSMRERCALAKNGGCRKGNNE